MSGSINLGIDVGTSSTKCLAVDERGRAVALAQRHYGLVHPREGWAEQDAEELWRALVACVRECVGQCAAKGYRSSDVKSLAMSTQGDTLIATDGAGNPVAPAISWMDIRPDEECRELLEMAEQKLWYREMGIVLTAYSTAAKIRWLQKRAPKIWAKTRRLCWVPDFMAKRLCGEFVTDVPSASWSCAFSPAARAYSPEVMRLLGIDESMLPAAVESGTPIGNLTPEAAGALGLTNETKLIAGAFDQAAAAHGAGASVNGRAVLSCGTAWVMYTVSDQPPVDELCRVPICCHTGAGEWGMVLPFSGGAAYDWLQDICGASEGPKSEGEPPVFVPHLYGGVCPDWREDSKGSLVGLTMSHTREDIRLAMMRGIASEARRNFEVARELGVEIDSLRMVGGAGKSDIWPQMIANILGVPIEVSDLLESACYGAAKLAAGDIAAGWVGTDTARRCGPDPERAAFEDRQYSRYLRFYNALLPQYEIDAEA